MVTMYLLQNRNQLTHTYTQSKRDKMIESGWNWTATIHGWNQTISYRGGVK